MSSPRVDGWHPVAARRRAVRGHLPDAGADREPASPAAMRDQGMSVPRLSDEWRLHFASLPDDLAAGLTKRSVRPQE